MFSFAHTKVFIRHLLGTKYGRAQRYLRVLPGTSCYKRKQECSNNDKDVSKVHKRPFEGTPSGKSGTNWTGK